MVKVLFLTLLLSVLSITVIAFTPASLEKNIGPSPYRAQLDELHAKTSKGLPIDAPEWNLSRELIQKNNAWFEKQTRPTLKEGGSAVFEAFRNKSDSATLFLMVIWGLGFYYILKSIKLKSALLVLIFPTVLFSFGFLSSVAIIGVFISIFCAYLFFIYRWNKT
ncbi:hypothetical protein OFY17_14575 [Marinomonas sp. C2222]|uniref:Uncharacterized protein n=1 Tax=Marinomonas sargassi TaxID=2984494 RepID=A0ABT2YW60_9GAMM|nr:hypothetical protein [Marinomonas sargassi]MCV2404088.1 hypothetical protein [Marinomonas sargassi]